MRWSLSLIITLALAAPSLAGIRIVSERAEVDLAARAATFTVTFDAPPDFLTVDAFGRAADSFQYEIDDDWRAPVGLPVEGLDSVVRGDEIYIADALRVRDAAIDRVPDPDPAAGGWGRVLDEVPFELSGNELRFVTPLASIGDDDGAFAYRLFTTEFGATTSEVESRVLPIPLPPAVPGAMATVVLLASARLLRRRGSLSPVRTGEGQGEGLCDLKSQI
jgi:hypothetical protein